MDILLNCFTCTLIWTGRCNCKEYIESLREFHRDRVHEAFSQMVQEVGKGSNSAITRQDVTGWIEKIPESPISQIYRGVA